MLRLVRARYDRTRKAPPRDPLAAMENAVVEAIARCEKSVVAVARIDEPDPIANARGGAGGLNPRQDPDSPDFLPDHYGAGVVVDRRGLILTNYHVLSAKAAHWVVTSDRKRYRARIKAADPRSDLAVLEIDAQDLAPIALGDASTLKKGQFVVALGNPYAIARDGSPSAAFGLIANLGRRLPTDSSPNGPGRDKLYHYGMLIQTDAKLNLGTSGGALLNLKGEMIGLTTSLAALSGYEQAAGYALPTDETFRRVVDVLKQGREVEYGFLGVKPENLTDDERTYAKIGVRVSDVVNGTPAQRYGLQVGDIVTHVGPAEIRDIDDIVLKVGQFPVETTIPVKFLRETPAGVEDRTDQVPGPGREDRHQRARRVARHDDRLRDRAERRIAGTRHPHDQRPRRRGGGRQGRTRQPRGARPHRRRRVHHQRRRRAGA
ncbi:MAG: trypsin-like peptidase domain-containing protein [Pirellulales bacterium]